MRKRERFIIQESGTLIKERNKKINEQHEKQRINDRKIIIDN